MFKIRGVKQRVKNFWAIIQESIIDRSGGSQVSVKSVKIEVCKCLLNVNIFLKYQRKTKNFLG